MRERGGDRPWQTKTKHLVRHQDNGTNPATGAADGSVGLAAAGMGCVDDLIDDEARGGVVPVLLG